jgi:hypothetical protein
VYVSHTIGSFYSEQQLASFKLKKVYLVVVMLEELSSHRCIEMLV